MSYKIDVSYPEIKEKILDVLSNSTTDWVHLGYEPGSNTKIKVVQIGCEGFEEMLEQLNEGKVQYFYVRFSQGANLYKYVFIAYVGEGASGMLRGNSHNHTIDLGNFLKTLRAPIHVQVNARSEADLDEAAIQKQLKGAMGSNYDAGAKNQGVAGGVKTVGEGVKIHKEAQEESAKNSDKRALPFIPDANTREQFWSKHNEDAARNKGKANQPVINEQERKNFWEKQQKDVDQQPKLSPSAPVVSGASNLRAQFEQKAAEQVVPQAQPASGGKKWTPPPASSKPPPSTAPPPVTTKPPVVSSPPPVTTKPPVSSPPPVTTKPPVSSPPPVASQPPPPVSSHPPSYSAAPPPLPAGGPPVPAGGPPVSHPPEPEDTWAEPEPEPEPPSQSAPTPSEEFPAVTALYAFEAEQPTDLSFNEGDTIFVLDRSDPSGWWKGRDAYGNEGYFPMNFVML